MKITQIDYSAIRNANASKYNALQQDVQNQAVDLSLQSLDRQISANNTNRAIQAFKETVNAVNSITSTIKEYKQTADTTSANNYLTEATNDLSVAIQEQTNQGSIASLDADGNIVIGDALKNMQAEQIAHVDEMNLMPEVADALKASLTKMHDTSNTDVQLKMLQNEYNAIQTGREQQLQSTLALDAANENYDFGYEAIDGFAGLSDTERANAKASYKASVDNSIYRNKTQSLAINDSYEAAKDYIDSIPDQDLILATGEKSAEDARRILRNLAREVYKQETSDLVQETSNAATTLLQQGANPAIMRSTINKSLQGMDPDRKTQIQTEVDKAQLSFIKQSMPELTQIESLSIGDLQLLRWDVMDNEAMFWGMEDYYESYLNQIDTQLAAYGVSASKEASDSEKEYLQATKQIADVAKNTYLNGDTSSAETVAFLQSTMKERAGKTLSLEDDNYILSAIRSIENVQVPEEYQDTVNSFLKTFEDSYRAFRGIDENDKSFSQAVATARTDAYKEILDLFRTTASKNMTTEKLTARLEQINNAYMGQVIEEMGKSAENYNGLAVTGVTGAVSYSNFNESNDMLGTSNSVAVSSSGAVTFRSTEAQSLSLQVKATGQQVLKQLGVETIATADYTVGDDGSVSSYPTYVDGNGTRYTIQNGTVYSKNGSNNSWAKLATVQASQDITNANNGSQSSEADVSPRSYMDHARVEGNELIVDDAFWNGVNTKQEATARMNEYIENKGAFQTMNLNKLRKKFEALIEQRFGK